MINLVERHRHQRAMTTKGRLRANVSSWLPLVPVDKFPVKTDSVRAYHDLVFAFTSSDRVHYLAAADNHHQHQLTEIEALAGKQIIDVVFTSECYFALSASGQVFAWIDDTVVTLAIDKDIVSLKCGAKHCLALRADGQMIMLQVKVANDNHHLSTMTVEVAVHNDEKIIDIDCGSEHSLALSEQGRVYSWGDNTYQQLGVAKGTQHRSKPEVVPLGEPICLVRCGSHHSLYWAASGKLYISGEGFSLRWQQLLNIDPETKLDKLVVVSYFDYDQNDRRALIACGLRNGTADMFEVGAQMDQVRPPKTRVFGLSLADAVLQHAKFKAIPAAITLETQKTLTPNNKVVLIPGGDDDDDDDDGKVQQAKSTTITPNADMETKLPTLSGNCRASQTNISGKPNNVKAAKATTTTATPKKAKVVAPAATPTKQVNGQVVPAKTNNVQAQQTGTGVKLDKVKVAQPTTTTTKVNISKTTTSATSVAQKVTNSADNHEKQAAETTQTSNKPSKLLLKIAQSFNDPGSTDIIFSFPAESKSIYAHSCYLKMTSDYLKEKLSGPWKGKEVIAIEDIDYAVFHQYLKYLYTERIDQIEEGEVLLKLILLAKQANEFDAGLGQLCSEQLDDRLNLTTCCFMFEVVHELGLRELEAKTLDFIVANFEEVLTQDAYLELKPDNMRIINLCYKSQKAK